jgi:hypothetical protein
MLTIPSNSTIQRERNGYHCLENRKISGSKTLSKLSRALQLRGITRIEEEMFMNQVINTQIKNKKQTV